MGTFKSAKATGKGAGSLEVVKVGKPKVKKGLLRLLFGSVLVSNVDLSREHSSLPGPLESELALWKSLKLGS